MFFFFLSGSIRSSHGLFLSLSLLAFLKKFEVNFEEFFLRSWFRWWRWCDHLHQRYLHGQLVPSGVRAMVLPSGQHPKGVLSHDERSSPVGRVVAATVGPAGRHDVFIHNRALSSILRSSPLLGNLFFPCPSQKLISWLKATAVFFKGHFKRGKMHYCGIAPGYLQQRPG